MKIRPIEIADSAAVAKLHIRNLRTNFSGHPGLQLLQLYYKAIAGGMGGCGFVAEQSNCVIGFVCGIWDQKSLRRYLFTKYLIALGFWGAIQILFRPTLLLSMMKRFRPEEADDNNNLEGYELRPIVVSKEARGTGAAVGLVERLIKDAAQRGYRKMHLITEQENVAAQKFYQKVGFKEVGSFSRLGTLYLQYERSLEDQ